MRRTRIWGSALTAAALATTALVTAPAAGAHRGHHEPPTLRVLASGFQLPTHVAFGFGEHLCLGASLARLETRVFFEEFLARFPDYELAGPIDRTPSTLVRGARRMPVVLSAD